MTNAGYGSNLTLGKTVECDASVMYQNHFGAVGAVSGLKNPIEGAAAVLINAKSDLPNMGRIPPMYVTLL